MKHGTRLLRDKFSANSPFQDQDETQKKLFSKMNFNATILTNNIIYQKIAEFVLLSSVIEKLFSV